MKLKSISVFLITLMTLVFAGPIQAKAADDCGFGFEFFSLFSLDGQTEIDSEEKCRISTWDYSRTDDGFSRYFSISMDPDVEDGTNTDYSSIEIFCDKKKIEVYIWVEYADSFGWSGAGQVRFDTGAPKKLPYLVQKDFDGIVIKDTKTFMQNLVKTKKKVSFKVPTVDGYEVLVYPKGNLLQYRSIFAKAGCKF